MLTNLDLSSELAKSKHFPAVDVVKFICSFLVIAIHVAPLTDVNAYINHGVQQYVARLAVPFFFVAGGTSASEKLTSIILMPIFQKHMLGG